MDISGRQTGGLISAMSGLGAAFSDANAMKASSDFKARQLDLNAKLADLQGASVIEAGNLESAMVGKKVSQVIGAGRASAAGQGVVVDSGSAAEVQKSSQVQGALEEETIKRNAWKEAWGFETEAENFRSEANMHRLEGSGEQFNTLMTGGMKAIADIDRGFLKDNA